jgi:hypothetical protein
MDSEAKHSFWNLIINMVKISPRLLWNPKVQQRIQESDRNQINPLHPLTYFFMINFSVNLPFMSQPPNRPISVRFSVLYRENDMKEKLSFRHRFRNISCILQPR